MRILELFSGIGACSKALERLGVDVEIVDAVENDKYAMASFNAIHGTQFSVSDIRDWNKDIGDIDLITHGSPCQDFSIAGKQAGGDLGSGTRSSLMYETIRIVGKIRPKYVLWENVKNILSKKHKHNFDSYIETMNILGYNSYYKVLNAKDYGVPQNRERVYTVSIRKDIDMGYEFPEPMELKLRLKDILEDEVDEKYYLDDEKVKKIINSNFMQEKKRVQEKDVCDTLLARDWKDPKCVQVGKLDIKGYDCVKRVYSGEGLAPTLTDMQGGNRQPKIIEDFYKNRPLREYDEIAPTLRSERIGLKVTEPLANDSMGVVERINKNAKHQQDLVQSQDDICRVIPAGTHGSTPHLLKTIVNENPLRIRKLTPKECWRLMGFDDEDFEKAERVPTSNTQLYKQARKLNLRTSTRKNI